MMEEPAFPVSTIDGFTRFGMTLRDWFAGQALAADSRGLLAERCYAIADAMIEARCANTKKIQTPYDDINVAAPSRP